MPQICNQNKINKNKIILQANNKYINNSFPLC